MKNMITLKEAIKEFPTNAEKILWTDWIGSFNDYPYAEKFSLIGRVRRLAIVNVKDNELFFGIKEIRIKRVGRTFYQKTHWTSCISIKGNKISGSIDGIDTVKHFFSFINRPIINDLSNKELSILCKNYMIKAILCKKVYGMETFYKEFMLKSYKIKNFDWRVFRNYYNLPTFDLIITDLIYFTNDLRKSMVRIIDCYNSEHYPNVNYNLIRDIVHSAAQLNQIVDLTWSDNRLREFHLDQTRLLMAKEIEGKEQVPVYNSMIGNKDIKLLNCEKDVFMEGYTMHHCLYTNYWSRIKDKNYIAFHMNSPEDCTFSVKLVNNNLFFDQIFLAYDKQVQDTTRRIAESFIMENSSELLKLLKHE